MPSQRQVARHVLNQSTRLAGWASRNRRAGLPANGPVKVNLGCGLQVAPGWVNIDGSLNALIAAAPHWMCSLAYKFSGANAFYSKEYYCSTLQNNLFIHHNLAYGIPLQNEVADFIYSSHFLEHLDQASGQRLMEECFRVLKPGGVLRIAVPDLEYAWEMYRRGEKERMIHDFFFTGEGGGLGQHRYAYDYQMLSTLLHDVGFNQVERSDFQEGATPDLQFLDNREDYTLFVEARRPHKNDSDPR
jgi:predicted SAM-dependent methyltransferase